ncbi:alpha/beta hydrolase [Devosia aurantiaca]|nr:alpha/beta hydrolase [Devosia aurantiaca]
MRSLLLATTALAALSMPALAQEEPRTVEDDVATSKDSGTVDRSNPEMAQVITKLMELGAKPVHTLDVPAARTQPTPADAVKAVYLETTGKQPFPEPVGKTEDIKVDGAEGELDARVYWPEGMADGGEALPVIVYFHGGGWVIANLNVYDASPRALANQAKAVVVSVHYRQGPEDKFPAAHDDAIAAYSYIVENAGEWNGDSSRVAVAGESAGGNLAVNVAIAARDQQLTEPSAILAVYPVAGDDLETQSYIANQNAVPLGKADIEWFVGHYLNDMSEAADPRIDLVGSADLEDLPPVTIVAAEIDPLNSEGMTLRDKLEEAGVEVAYQNWNGVTHEFFGMAAVVPEAKEAQDFAGSELREALGSE